MWLNKNNTQIAIGLLVFGLSMITIAHPFDWYKYLQLMRELQFSATLALLFGILKAQAKHKDKFLLLWLVITVFCCLCLLKAGLMHWCDQWQYGQGSFIWVFLPWIFAVGVAYLWHIIYKDYVNLTVGATEEAEETVVTQEKPPPKYPNTDNLTILVHGQRMK